MKKAQIMMLAAALVITMSGCAAEQKTVPETTSDAADTASYATEIPTSTETTAPAASITSSLEKVSSATLAEAPETVPESSYSAVSTAEMTETSAVDTTAEPTTTTAAAENDTTTTPESTPASTTASSATEPTTADKTEAPETIAEIPEYDNSAEYPATVLKSGDALNGGTYTATGKDESVLEASGNVHATVIGAVLKKVSGDASSADDSSFKGVNAGVRVYGSAEVTLTDCAVEADAKNATGVFAYDKGVIYISDSMVTVTGGGAGGIQVAGGGTLFGTNLTVTSASKAAIRSDRGGGTMVIDGGTYTSEGSSGCPVIYSTADITVKNAVGVSKQSRAVIIEGKNSVTLENCTLTGNDRSTKAGSIRANVLLYQSASGDAKEGTSVFSMTGGKMISESGAMFYCTNTSSIVNLNSAELVLSDSGELLTVSAGRWGKDGRNGGSCVLNAEDQTLAGSITVDSISSLELNLTNSTYKGVIMNEGKVSVNLGSDSKWELTGDSYITSFSGDASNIISNGYTLYVNGRALSGTN